MKSLAEVTRQFQVLQGHVMRALSDAHDLSYDEDTDSWYPKYDDDDIEWMPEELARLHAEMTDLWMEPGVRVA